MSDYKFGTLVFLPAGDLAEVSDKLRHEYDQMSANSAGKINSRSLGLNLIYTFVL